MLNHIQIAFLSIAMAYSLPAQKSGWPPIQPLNETKSFVDAGKNDTDTPYLVFIKDEKGNPVYKLECHNGYYEDNSAINYSGDFQCALFAIQGENRTTWNLLATDSPEEQSSDWKNRGRMTANQLRGQCNSYPEYSSLRHFKLRGMLITFGYIDPVWSGPGLDGFTFKVSVVPDKSADSHTATDPSVAKPPKSCY